MTHAVTARRKDMGAQLWCAICRSKAIISGDDFDGMNRFVAEHKLCLDATP